jgi:hypothetical protein
MQAEVPSKTFLAEMRIQAEHGALEIDSPFRCTAEEDHLDRHKNDKKK